MTVSVSGARRLYRQLVIQQGWQPGTDLEDRVAFRLGRWGHRPPTVAQQHRAGRYRIDFAWVDMKIGLEADGWHHERPESAAKDARRDRWLREQGWLIFRIHDAEDATLAEQLVRVVDVVRLLQAEHRRP